MSDRFLSPSHPRHAGIRMADDGGPGGPGGVPEVG